MLEHLVERFIRGVREVSIMFRLPSPGCPAPAFLDKVTAVGGLSVGLGGPSNNGSDRYQMSPDTLSGTALCIAVCNSAEANTFNRHSCSAKHVAGLPPVNSFELSSASNVNCWDYLTFNLHPILPLGHIQSQI